MAKEGKVTIERLGPVALVTLNDPATRNALSPPVVRELCIFLVQPTATMRWAESCLRRRETVSVPAAISRICVTARIRCSPGLRTRCRRRFATACR